MSKKIIVYKMLAMACTSWCLMACTSSNSYDSIRANDTNTTGYSVKAEFPTSHERVTVVAEHQATKGDDTSYHYPVNDYRSTNEAPFREWVEVRPAIITQNNFALSANSIGVKWNVLDKPKFGLSLYLNIMQMKSEVDIDVPAYLTKERTSAQVKTSDVDLAGKVELYVPIGTRVRFVSSLLTAGNLINEEASLDTFSLGFDYLASKNITLGLSYKRWNYYLDNDPIADTILDKEVLNFSSKSEVHLSSKGISGELSYRF